MDISTLHKSSSSFIINNRQHCLWTAKGYTFKPFFTMDTHLTIFGDRVPVHTKKCCNLTLSSINSLIFATTVLIAFFELCWQGGLTQALELAGILFFFLCSTWFNDWQAWWMTHLLKYTNIFLTLCKPVAVCVSGRSMVCIVEDFKAVCLSYFTVPLIKNQMHEYKLSDQKQQQQQEGGIYSVCVCACACMHIHTVYPPPQITYMSFPLPPPNNY